jgi:hypothetical protein
MVSIPAKLSVVRKAAVFMVHKLGATKTLKTMASERYIDMQRG